MKVEFEEIFKLGRAEKLQLVQDLWDSIDIEDDTPVSKEVIAELRRRKTKYDADPKAVRTWEQVKASVRK